MVQRDTVHSTIEHIKKVNRDIDFQMEKLLIQEASDISSMDSEPYEMLKNTIKKHLFKCYNSSVFNGWWHRL